MLGGAGTERPGHPLWLRWLAGSWEHSRQILAKANLTAVDGLMHRIVLLSTVGPDGGRSRPCHAARQSSFRLAPGMVTWTHAPKFRHTLALGDECARRFQAGCVTLACLYCVGLPNGLFVEPTPIGRSQQKPV